MADHIVYSCVAYRYMTGWEGVVTDTLETPDDDVSFVGAESTGGNSTIVALVAAALDADSATFSGSSSWDASGQAGASFHIWTQGDTGHGGGIYSGAIVVAAPVASGTWISSIAEALPQAFLSWVLIGTQPPEVYDQTKGEGVDDVEVPLPIFGGGFYLVLYVQTANEEVATPEGWTLVGSVGVGTPGAAGATRITVFAADADDSPPAPTLTIVEGGGEPEEIEGTLSATLGAATASGAGSVAVSGALEATLGALTAEGAGAVVVAGALDTTLGAATAEGAGAVAVRGAASASLGAVTASGAGTVAIEGTAAPTLAPLTSSGDGEVPVSGAANVELGALACAGAGAVAITGSADAALGELTAAGVGIVARAGALAVTLGALTVEASGTVADNAVIPSVEGLRLVVADERRGIVEAGRRTLTVRDEIRRLREE